MGLAKGLESWNDSTNVQKLLEGGEVGFRNCYLIGQQENFLLAIDPLCARLISLGSIGAKFSQSFRTHLYDHGEVIRPELCQTRPPAIVGRPCGRPT
jgi:hypothetical protein